MPILTRPEFGPRTALTYVTIGALMDVWCIVWYFTHGVSTTDGKFWIIGLIATGFILLVIGLLLGRLGRAARQAELPPHEAVQAEADIQRLAAANGNQTQVPPPVAQQPATPVQSTVTMPTYAR